MRRIDRCHGRDDGRRESVPRHAANGRQVVCRRGEPVRGERDREEEFRARDSHGSKASSSKPEEVIDALFKATKKARVYFEGLKDEFENDIKKVQAYASSDVLNDLWMARFRLEQTARAGGKAFREMDARGFERSKVGYRDVAGDLCGYLEGAASVTHSRRDFTLAKKLHNTEKLIVEWFRALPRSLKALKELLTELEMLSVLLEHNGARKESHRGGSGPNKKTQQTSGARDKHGRHSRSPNRQKGRGREPQQAEQSDSDDDQHHAYQSEQEDRRQDDSDYGGQDGQQDSEQQDEVEREGHSEEENP